MNIMERDWDARAREDSRRYIATLEHSGIHFSLSGLRDAYRILEDIHPHLAPETRLLEIGCGIGRMLQFWALLFAEVAGADVSGEMIEQARSFLAAHRNVRLFKINGEDLQGIPDAHFDVVVSYVVFQHIPFKEKIESLVREARRVLRVDGVFKFHVKTGPWPGQGSLDTWCGADVGPEDLAAWAGRNRFRILNMYSDLNNTGWAVFQAVQGPGPPG